MTARDRLAPATPLSRERPAPRARSTIRDGAGDHVIQRVARIHEPPHAPPRHPGRVGKPEYARVLRGRLHDAERRPQHRHRGHEGPKTFFGIGPGDAIADEHRRPAPQSQRSCVIEPQRVRRGDPRRAASCVAAPVVLVTPAKPDQRGRARQAGARPSGGAVAARRRQRLRHERPRRSRTRGQHDTGGNVGKRAQAVKQKRPPDQ